MANDIQKSISISVNVRSQNLVSR